MWHRYLNNHGGSSLFKSLKSGLPHSLNFKLEQMMNWEQWCLDLNKVGHFTFDPISMTCQASPIWPDLLFYILEFSSSTICTGKTMQSDINTYIKMTRVETTCSTQNYLSWPPHLFMELPDYTQTCFCTLLTNTHVRHMCLLPSARFSERSDL